MNSKINTILLGLVMSGLFSHAAMAADSTINITGNIVASPCIPEVTKNIDFGDIDASVLAAPRSWSKEMSSSIILTKCPATTTSVIATFSGTADKNSPDDFASTGVAKNVSIELKEGKNILNNGAVKTVAVNATDHTATVAFNAYIMNSSTTAAPAAATPGSVIGAVQVAFDYK